MLTNLSSASEIASLGSRGDGIEAGVLDVGGDVHVVQVSQHHDGGEEKSGGVGFVLTSDIWGRAVDLGFIFIKNTDNGLTDSKRATPSAPMLPEGVRPRPPIKPAPRSERISP